MLNGKKIVLGVSGGIAAYKAVEIVSRLKKAGAVVQVIMTEAATQFVSALTFREMSGNPVAVAMWSEIKHWNVEHIALAKWADLFLIAPATANIIGKIANGIADDTLSTTVMATKAPVIIAPAMNTEMYVNPIVQENISKLAGLGYRFIEPASGMLACGVEGQGRLPEPSAIVEYICQTFAPFTINASIPCDFSDKKFLITAGGTREPIDPVRYIGNHSSGKMGYALAAAAAARGGRVTLISAPTKLSVPEHVSVKYIETAAEMRQAVLAEYPDADIVIKAAAVADYKPKTVQLQKIKKNDDTLTLVLEKNPDILKELGQLKQNQFLVGFAAETESLIQNATDKLNKKNLDMIIANDVTKPGAGFDYDTNTVKILYRDGLKEEFLQMTKIQLAHVILDKIRVKLKK
ncbi:putative coenzyme A biosynthesis bifunctional protein CoaBC [Propionispora sp. 2/2-37]|uniref:bifunctional phosphopantothenoylcysteine decarboxylase/phosphopantothenate--cysteine ligase CoaBC n=1 Tax=Propionispora sp. 2/2-37 TaxID=1677858 RepID=UPI0006BB8AD0|nr:bifunctional phosphopantothenoylcysteine decarboxylase/phosphopantothenate--cysteine ligase CoaBC [Propionispora sp. 2/2-37]CUH94209.1 putative coenzyme A biosynthesis bifunctional protein CoaBC [Propionispora sp. 2/2-37]